MTFLGSECVKCGSTKRYAFRERPNGRCAVCTVATNKAWNSRNRTVLLASDRAWKKRNQKRIREYGIARYHADPKKYAKKLRRWQLENRETVLFYVANRRAAQEYAYQDGTVTVEFLREVYAAKHCFYCEKPFKEREEVTADHRIPIRAYGAPHAGWNIVAAHQACNSEKADRLDCKMILDVISTPGGRLWAEGDGAKWLSNVLPKLQNGPRLARELFATSLGQMSREGGVF